MERSHPALAPSCSRITLITIMANIPTVSTEPSPPVRRLSSKKTWHGLMVSRCREDQRHLQSLALRCKAHDGPGRRHMGEVDGLRHGLGYKPAEVVHGPDERRVLGAISPPSLRTTMPLGSLPVRRISGSCSHMRVPEIHRRMAQGPYVPPPNPAVLRSNIRKSRQNSDQNQVCELDHLVPLELGGADGLGNIWPQCGPDSVALNERYFKIKDRVEVYLADEVKK